MHYALCIMLIHYKMINLLEDETNDNETQKSSVKTLEQLGELVDSNELKEMIKNSLSFEKFKAHIGTLRSHLEHSLGAII